MKAKKILAGACASLMLAMTTVSAVSAAETVTVKVGNVTAEPGDTFSVNIDLSDIPAAGINGCDFGIKFDSSALTITNVAAGVLAKEDPTSLEDVAALETNIETGLVSVIYGLGTTETSNYITGSGTFLTLEGTVNSSAEAGKYDLEIVAVDRLADTTGTTTNTEIIFGNLAEDNKTSSVFTPTITDGWVEVTSGSSSTTPSIGEPTLLGDVDDNGIAYQTSDIVMLAKHVAAPTVYDITVAANGELDGSAGLTGGDLGAMIEGFLAG